MMTMSILRSASCLILLAVISPQNSLGPIPPLAASPGTQRQGTVEDLRTEVGALYARLEPRHLWIRALRREWDRRLDLCRNAQCRMRLLEEQNDRLRAVAASPAVPSRLEPPGAISIAAGGAFGTVETFPSRAGRILVTVDTMERNGRWFCNLIGEGQFESERVLVVETLDEFATRYRLRDNSDGTIEIDSIPEYDNHLCGTAGSLQGRYQVQRVDAAEP